MSLFDQISSPYGVGAAPYKTPVVVQPNDSVLSALSRGGIPLGALVTNYGQKHHPGQGRSTMDCLLDVDSGVSAAFVQNGGSFNTGANGGSGPGAGQQGQYQGLGAGCSDQLPHTAPVAAPAVQLPTGTSGTGGVPPTFGSPVLYA